MIFLLIGLFIIIIGTINFKKGFYFFLFYKVLLVTNITVLSIPGIPLLTLDMFLTAVFLLLYFFKVQKMQLEYVPFPYSKPFKWMAFSYFLSTLFAYIGFIGAFSQYIGQVLTEFIFAWLMWKIINRKDIEYIIKGLAFMFLLSCVYAFYEKFTHTNPIQNYELTLVTDKSRAIDFLVTDDINRGYRVQSFFEHAIGAGMNWGMFVVLYFTLTIIYKYKMWNKLCLITAILCIPCIFFSNARGPLVFLMVSALSIIDLKNKKFYKLFVVGVVLFVVAFPLFSEYFDNLLSIFDSKAQDKVGGSNAEMRFDQLSASIELMMQSPLFGLGYKFMNVLHTSLVSRLLGLESIWFRVMTQFGLLGTFVNLMLSYYSLIKVPIKYKSKPLLFFSLAYWITSSLTSVPGMLIYLYYLILIILIKQSDRYLIYRRNMILFQKVCLR